MTPPNSAPARRDDGSSSAAPGQQADPAYFDLMADVAGNHWWYRARRALVADALGPRVRRGGRALDIGCGTGETVDVLESLGAVAVGTDLSTYVLAFAASRRTPRRRLLESLAEHLPFASGCCEVVTSMDVIEHIDDDVAALREYVRVLKPGGTVLLTVPAYQFLWSDHDVRAVHRRRYTRRRLEAAARAADIEVERSTYFFSFLVPPAILLRRTPLGRLVGDSDEEASSVHPAIDAIFLAASRVERWVGRWIPIPFGLSILLIGRTPSR